MYLITPFDTATLMFSNNQFIALHNIRDFSYLVRNRALLHRQMFHNMRSQSLQCTAVKHMDHCNKRLISYEDVHFKYYFD